MCLVIVRQKTRLVGCARIEAGGKEDEGVTEGMEVELFVRQ